MATMKELYEKYEDKVHSAKKYAKCAMNEKCCYPMLAKTYYEISVSDMTDAMKLRDEIERLIKTTDEEAESVQMMAVYDYMTDRMTEKIARAKEYQNMYREG